LYKRFKTQIETALFSNSLKGLAFRGGAWLAAGSVAEQTARFARNMILARLLAPSAFGTMAIVASASSALQAFTDIGAREALIQNPRGGEPQYVSAAWWMAFGRALCTYALVFLAAPFVARFYGNPELSALLRVAALSVLFEGAISTKAYLTVKDMKFSKWAAINHGGGVCGVAITLILSFYLRDVWAIVIGSCSESVARCLLSYVVCPYLPAFTRNWHALRDLSRFSRGLFGLSLLNLVFIRTDILVLAKLFPATDLGLYTMAVYLVQVPAGFAINLMGQVVLPTFCKMQGDNVRTNRVFLQITTAVMLLAMPVVVFMLFCGQPLLVLAYGPLYGSARSALILASCVALINVVNVQITAVFYASGAPQLHRRCVAVMAVAMLLFTYPLAKWLGVVGGQVAALVAVSAGFLFQAERIRHVTGLLLSRYGKAALLAVGPTLIVAATCLGYRTIGSASAIPTLGVGFLGCLMAYGVAAWLIVSRLTSQDALNQLPQSEVLAVNSDV
jgi:O-antigen/teichoic acid export membrane protein